MRLVEGEKRTVPGPEGVPLRFEIAPVGDRALAFLFDLALVVLLLLAAGVVSLVFGAILNDRKTGLAVFLLLVFVVRVLYFPLFEARWRGATPGKRRMGMRVIDRKGGVLAPGSIFARNISRELELIAPVGAMAAPDAVFPEGPPYVVAIALLWLLLVLVFPLLNRDRMRIGDLLAGKIVVRTPRVALLSDLAAAPKRARAAGHAFTPEQLDVYGVYELQVLEELLRSRTPGAGEQRKAVAAKIVSRIGFTGRMESPDRFLADFYAAQRARLERSMLLGRRRERRER